MKPQALSLFHSPRLTIYYFYRFLCEAIGQLIHQIVTHPIVIYVLIPVIAIYLVVNNLEGEHQAFVTEIEDQIAFVVWWVGLGVLSSVGLGTGLHTGLLFLFPHIFKVCLAASECLSTDFNSREMWFSSDETLFMCRQQGTASVHFFEIFRKIALPCFLWGSGTAFGEIPPYAISRAARLAGKTSEEFEEIQNSKSNWQVLDRMKIWMVDFLQRHGFIGIILMASWPNAAFDLCGICCGHFGMPFWEFVAATWIGKALIKANMQAAFFITVFTDRHLEQAVELIERLIPDSLEPCHYFVKKDCHHLVSELLLKARSQFTHKKDHVEGEKGWFAVIWPFVIAGFLSFFLISCINQCATMQCNKEAEKTNKNEKPEYCAIQ